MSFNLDRKSRVYIHQISKMRTAKTAELYSAMQSECIPLYREHGLELFAYWESAPGQGVSPEIVEIWEIPGFDVYSKFVAASYSDKADARLKQWSELRSNWIESSDNMLCLPHPKSPSLADLKQAGTKAKLAMHEMVHCQPSRQLDYLEAIYNMWWKPVAEPAGRTLLGLLYSPWNNRRAINIWGVGDTWDNLPILGGGKYYDPESVPFQTWMTMAMTLRDDWNDRFMIPAPFSPTA